jgi:MOSC domain-containing protein YiiM
MKLISVNVGLPREVEWNGQKVTTGIFKEPVEGRVMMRTLNLDGDRQGDLKNHGGPNKAVFGYPVEHYDFWRRELPGTNLPWGAFGENLTTEGLLEDVVNIGDRFRVGEAEVMVTQPRFPCYKLGIKFGRDDIIKRYLLSGRSGFYFAVLREGEIETGDPIEVIHQDTHNVTVADIVRLYGSEKDDLDLLRRAVRVEALSEGWRRSFQERIAKLDR